MKKLLKPSDLLLIGLAGLLDIFEEAKDSLGVMGVSCREIYGWVPEKYNKTNFSRVAQRRLKTGDIEKVLKDGNVYFRLTSEGKEKVVRDFPIFNFQNQKWDRKWRVVIFDIAEISRNSRDLLREMMRELGFGMLQESVWITPYDITLDFSEFIDESGLSDFVYLMEVSHLLAGSIESLVNRIWRLDEMNEKYKDILRKIVGLKNMYVVAHDRGVKRTYGEEEIEQMKREIRERYLDVIFLDPHLPKELLPKDWVGEKVRKEIKNI